MVGYPDKSRIRIIACERGLATRSSPPLNRKLWQPYFPQILIRNQIRLLSHSVNSGIIQNIPSGSCGNNLCGSAVVAQAA